MKAVKCTQCSNMLSELESEFNLKCPSCRYDIVAKPLSLREGIKIITADFAKHVEDLASKCDFCYGAGEHLCPDVAEPILIKCTKKGCPFVK